MRRFIEVDLPVNTTIKYIVGMVDPDTKRSYEMLVPIINVWNDMPKKEIKMTREEAIKIMTPIWSHDPRYSLAEKYINAFEALGLIKFEEKKYLQIGSGHCAVMVGIGDAIIALECNGYKVTKCP